MGPPLFSIRTDTGWCRSWSSVKKGIFSSNPRFLEVLVDPILSRIIPAYFHQERRVNVSAAEHANHRSDEFTPCCQNAGGADGARRFDDEFRLLQ